MAKGLISMVMVAALMLGPAGMDAAIAITLGVSPAGNDAGNCQGATPCQSISAAIANSSFGDTINVAAGTYSTESFPLLINEINLIGAGASTTMINAVGSGAGAILIDAAASSQATLQGFTIKSDLVNAVTINSGAGQNVSPTITGNTITATSSDGIYIYVSSTGTSSAISNPTITGNTIIGSLGYGIYVAGYSYATVNPSITNNDIINNGFTGISMGIFTGAPGAFINGTISGNTISYNAVYGVYIWAVSAGSADVTPSISRNTIIGNSDDAVYISSNNTLGVMAPDFGGGSRVSAGLNTIQADTFSGFSDIEISSVSNTVSALNNWFSSTPEITNTSGTVNYSALSGTLAFTVSPSSGLTTGGDSVTITASSGSAFVTDVGAAHTAIAVTFGGIPATVTSFSSSALLVTVPAGAEGPVSVQVTNPAGQTGTLASGYTYTTLTIPNYAPTAPILLSPASGATGIISNSVTFTWSRSFDLEGTAVQYDLYLCTDSTFSTCASPVNSTRIASNALPLDGAASVLVMVGIVAAGATLGRRRALMAALVALALVAMLIACGQGVSDTPQASDDSVSYDVTDLLATTTYYWMVTAYDADGQSASSAVSYFATE